MLDNAVTTNQNSRDINKATLSDLDLSGPINPVSHREQCSEHIGSAYDQRQICGIYLLGTSWR